MRAFVYLAVILGVYLVATEPRTFTPPPPPEPMKEVSVYKWNQLTQERVEHE